MYAEHHEVWVTTANGARHSVIRICIDLVDGQHGQNGAGWWVRVQSNFEERSCVGVHQNKAEQDMSRFWCTPSVIHCTYSILKR